MTLHGDTTGVDPTVFFGDDDPDIALVDADMRAWSEAHPCECEALCTCDKDRLLPNTDFQIYGLTRWQAWRFRIRGWLRLDRRT